MRLKAVVKYNLSDLKNSILIFYFIVAAVLALLSISYTNMVSHNINGSVGGVEMASVIFLFIIGLNSFKPNYYFLSAHGITRKGQFCGFLLSMIPVAGIMAIIDTAISNILAKFINYNSMFFQIYGQLEAGANSISSILVTIIWSMALYLFAVILGYFITTLYYRMTSLLKVIVSIGVPAIFIIIIPTVDTQLNNGKFLRWTGETIALLGGVKNSGRPMIAVISLIVEAVVLAALAYLLVRKAPVKE